MPEARLATRRRGKRFTAICVMLDSSANAGTGGEVHPTITHGKLHTAQCLQHHRLVKPAQMANPEYLAGYFAKPGTKGHTVIVVGRLDDFVCIKTWFYDHCCHRIGIKRRPAGAVAKAPCTNRGAHALGEAVVTCMDIVQALAVQHVD